MNRKAQIVNLIARVVLSNMLWIASAVAVDIPIAGYNPDINKDGDKSVVDVQCEILAALWSLADGDFNNFPECVGVPVTIDLDCSGAATVVDVALLINAVLGIPLDPFLDKTGSGVPDACENAPCEKNADCTQTANECDEHLCINLKCQKVEIPCDTQCVIDLCGPGVSGCTAIAYPEGTQIGHHESGDIGWQCSNGAFLPIFEASNIKLATEYCSIDIGQDWSTIAPGAQLIDQTTGFPVVVCPDDAQCITAISGCGDTPTCHEQRCEYSEELGTVACVEHFLPTGSICFLEEVLGLCSFGECAPACTDEVCGDGEDNDCDGLVDGEDIDCTALTIQINWPDMLERMLYVEYFTTASSIGSGWDVEEYMAGSVDFSASTSEVDLSELCGIRFQVHQNIIQQNNWYCTAKGQNTDLKNSAMVDITVNTATPQFFTEDDLTTWLHTDPMDKGGCSAILLLSDAPECQL